MHTTPSNREAISDLDVGNASAGSHLADAPERPVGGRALRCSVRPARLPGSTLLVGSLAGSVRRPPVEVALGTERAIPTPRRLLGRFAYRGQEASARPCRRGRSRQRTSCPQLRPRAVLR